MTMVTFLLFPSATESRGWGSVPLKFTHWFCFPLYQNRFSGSLLQLARQLLCMETQQLTCFILTPPSYPFGTSVALSLPLPKYCVMVAQLFLWCLLFIYFYPTLCLRNSRQHAWPLPLKRFFTQGITKLRNSLVSRNVVMVSGSGSFIPD